MEGSRKMTREELIQMAYSLRRWGKMLSVDYREWEEEQLKEALDIVIDSIEIEIVERES